tara:strand:- start:1178 stop:1492 length:315 start_codon:yes stop_codon:yes gene_type:complete
MRLRFLKIFTIIFSFLFLTGFMPYMSLVGPSLTAVTSGNLYKASAQFLIDQSVKKKTGKNSLMLVKEEIDKNNQKREFNEEFRQLVEKRINITRKKLNLNNINR